jgi:8-oxo-dGTP diphosphatase
MQAGGKIEPHQSAAQALAREIGEELGLGLKPDRAEYLGAFTAVAANETGRMVDAECFYISADLLGALDVSPAAEIEEIAWVVPHDVSLPLAPLTRDHLLPIARQRVGR